jgi:UPF0042 nucleotide-binding protein
MYPITLVSFGFKYGTPRANYYFDVGFVKNPARNKKWSFFSQPDDNMKSYVLEQELAKEFIEKVQPLIIFLSKIDQNQIFAFGCNAGRHRSNIIVDELAKLLKARGLDVKVVHRDLE